MKINEQIIIKLGNISKSIFSYIGVVFWFVSALYPKWILYFAEFLIKLHTK
jgi:hypothetical protein